jgi:hypothetical protein
VPGDRGPLEARTAPFVTRVLVAAAVRRSPSRHSAACALGIHYTLSELDRLYVSATMGCGNGHMTSKSFGRALEPEATWGIAVDLTPLRNS